MILFLVTYFAAAILAGVYVVAIDKLNPATDTCRSHRIGAAVFLGLFWPVSLVAIATLSGYRILKRRKR